MSRSRSSGGPPHPGEAPARLPGNLAARMGRWSARHWKTATFGWLVFVALAGAILFTGTIGTETIDADTSGPGESGRVDRILDAEFTQPADEAIVIDSETLTFADPAFRAAVDDALRSLSVSPDVQNAASPLATENADLVSADGHTVRIDFEIRGDPDDAVDKIDPIIAATDEVQRAHPELFVGQIGDASGDKGLEGAFGDDLKKAGILSVPITLVILLVTFGALVAAGLPLFVGLTAVLATLGLMALPSQLMPISQYASAVVLLIGLAVGVDYAMFYLKRARQERAAGRSERAAVEAAAATSGRSVLVSGLTVMVAMAGMFLTGDETFASFGLATMIVVAVAVLGSLTVLPALLSRLGDGVERGRIPFLPRRDDAEGRFWGAIVARVLRRPVLSVILAGGLLLALAAPALQLNTAVAGFDTFSKSIAVIETYDHLQAAFPGSEIPANVVVKAADVNAPEVQDQIAQLEQRALASGQFHEPVTVEVNQAATVANVAIPIDGDGTDDASNAALTTLRDEIVPATVGTLTGAELGVTGATAQSRDFGDNMNSALPLVFAFVLVLAFVLMLVAFRSIVIAVKAIVLNLLSVGAAYGIMVLVFQHGWGKDLLGFESTVGIDPVLPILLFVILFGLSMDYHVFIISRIRELHDRGASTDQAILGGIRSTAGVVTSAALVMVCVFAVFGTLSMLFFKQFGVGLAAAVLIDATIVRAVLLPATMKLLGEANWYLPGWLEWLPGKAGEPLDAPAASAPGLTPTG